LCISFSEKVELHVNATWYDITFDIGLQHIMLEDGKINYIDRERRTIGLVEYMIADFLLDILTDKADYSLWLTLLNEEMSKDCNKKEIIESLAYKLFYKTILESVLHQGKIDQYLDALKILLHLEDHL